MSHRIQNDSRRVAHTATRIVFTAASLIASLIVAGAPRSLLAQSCEPTWLPGEGAPGAGPPGPAQVYDFVVYDDGTGPALYMVGLIAFAGNARIATVEDGAVVRWDESTLEIVGEVNGSIVPAITVYDGKLISGGTFTDVDGVLARNVAAWDGTTWSALGAGIQGGGNGVWDLFVHDGLLFATGGFTVAGGGPAANIAQWDGAAWSALGSGISNTGRALAAFEGDLAVGGLFVTAGGDTVHRVARWDGTDWSTFGSGLIGSQVYALSTFDMDGAGPDPERLIAGGSLGASGIDHLAYWSGTTWVEFAAGTSNAVHSLLPVGGDLIVGGLFNASAARIARWTPGVGWAPIGAGFNGGSPSLATVYALAEFADALYAGGDFDCSGTQSMLHVARWDGVAWSALAPGIGGSDQHTGVYSLVPYGDGVLVGGRFTSVGNAVDANDVAFWTPAGWSALGSGLGSGTDQGITGSVVNALALHEEEIYAAWFELIGGTAASRVSYWDGAAWNSIASLESGSSLFNAIHSHGGDLYVAGTFTLMGSTTMNRIARWDGATWSPLVDSLVGVNGGVDALDSCEGDFIIGGRFTTAGGVPANHVARWDGTTFSATDVRAIASVGDDLYLTGGFIGAGGVSAVARIARWDGTQVYTISAGLSANGLGAYALARLADGTVAVGHREPFAGDEVSYCFAWIDPCIATSAGYPSPSDAAWDGLEFAGAFTHGGGAAFLLSLLVAADVRLAVYDVSGREIALWRDALVPAGRHRLALETLLGRRAAVASGVYFAKLDVRDGARVASRVARAVLVR